MKTAAPLLFAVAGLAVGLGVGMTLSGDEAPPENGAQAGPAAGAATSAAELDALRAELDAAQRDSERAALELEEARDRAVAATERAVRAEEEAAATAVTEETIAYHDEKDETKHSISIEGYDEALAKVDWSTVGPNMKAMVPIIQRITDAMAAGESPKPEDVGAIQKHNGPLVAAALSVGDSIPGTGPNGRFSSPAFMVNAIASTLQASELPLTKEQAQALQTAGVDFSRQDKVRIAGYAADAYELQKMIDETKLKDTFFKRAFALLTPEQTAALSPEATRDRTQVDIFSSALIWAGRVRMDRFNGEEDLVEKVTGYMVRGLKLPESDHDALRIVATNWVAGLPTSLKETEQDALAKNGMLPKDTVLGWASNIIEYWRRIEATLQLSEDARKQLRAAGRTPVLFRMSEGS